MIPELQMQVDIRLISVNYRMNKILKMIINHMIKKNIKITHKKIKKHPIQVNF